MQIFLIFSFIIAFVAIIFAIQNTEVTTIQFLFWETEGSLALILFIAMVAGALISYLATTPNQIRQRMTISSQRKQMVEIEGQLTRAQEELATTQGKLQEIQEQQATEPPQEGIEEASLPGTDDPGNA